MGGRKQPTLGSVNCEQCCCYFFFFSHFICTQGWGSRCVSWYHQGWKLITYLNLKCLHNVLSQRRCGKEERKINASVSSPREVSGKYSIVKDEDSAHLACGQIAHRYHHGIPEWKRMTQSK